MSSDILGTSDGLDHTVLLELVLLVLSIRNYEHSLSCIAAHSAEHYTYSITILID